MRTKYVVIGEVIATGSTFLVDVNGVNLFGHDDAFRHCDYFNDHVDDIVSRGGDRCIYTVKRLAKAVQFRDY